MHSAHLLLSSAPSAAISTTEALEDRGGDGVKVKPCNSFAALCGLPSCSWATLERIIYLTNILVLID